MKNFIVTVRHDNGTKKIRVPAMNEDAAKQIVMTFDNCPESAIIKVREAGYKKAITKLPTKKEAPVENLTDRLLDNPMQDEQDMEDLLEAAYPAEDIEGFTSGEWIIEKCVDTGDLLVRAIGGPVVADCEGSFYAHSTTKPGETKANAALIASAPRLYRENKVLVSQLEEMKKSGLRWFEMLQASEGENKELKEKLERSNRLLSELTPNGSEFYNDPEKCAKWIKESRDEAHYTMAGIIKDVKKENKELKEVLQALRKLVTTSDLAFSPENVKATELINRIK